MKKLLSILLGAALLPLTAFGQAFDANQVINPVTQGVVMSDGNPFSNLTASSAPTVNYITATSTTRVSTFPNASTTNFSASVICFLSDTCRSTWPTGGGSSDWTRFNTSGLRPATSTDSVLIGGTATTTRAQLQILSQAGIMPLSIGSTTGTYLEIESDGKIGIGTSSPPVLFTIQTSGTGNYTTMDGTNLRGYNSDSLRFALVPNGNNVYGLMAGGANVDGGVLDLGISTGRSYISGGQQGASLFNVFTGSLTAPRLTITSAGNVGISTTSPTSKLEISAVGAANGALLTFSGLQLSSNDIIRVRAIDSMQGWKIRSAGGVQEQFRVTDTNDVIKFQVDTISGPAYINAGNFGVGTSTPAYSLSVPGTIGIGTGGINSPTISTTGTAPNENLALTPAGTGNVLTTVNKATPIIHIVTNTSTGAAASADVSVRNSAGVSAQTTISQSSTGFTPYGAWGPNEGLLYNNSGSLNIMADTAGGMIKFSAGGNGEDMRITSAGNIGIGTSTSLSDVAIQTGASAITMTGTGSVEGLAFNRDVATGSIIGTSRSAFQITNNASALSFSVFNGNGTQASGNALVIGSTGNIGVSTSTPGQKLEVAGNIMAGSGTAPDQKVLIGTTFNAGYGGLYMVGNGSTYSEIQSLYEGVATNPLILQRRGGKVGIGTTTPAFDLTPVATTDVAVARFVSANTSVDTIQLQGTAVNGYSSIGFVSSVGAAAGGFGYANANAGTLANKVYFYGLQKDLQFDSISGGNPSLIIKAGTANVGVATATPYAKFQISAGTGPQFMISNPLAGTNQKHWYASTTSTGDFALGMVNDALTTLTEDLRITAAGNVGIGTSTPAAKLDIYSNGSNPDLSITETAGGASAQIHLKSLTRTWDIGGDASPDIFYIQQLGGNQDTFTITAANNIGIGTSTPAWPLTVSNATKPQLAITDGSLTSPIWTHRNINGVYYIGTSSPSTQATSTVAAITIQGAGSGVPGISYASTTPFANLSITGTVAFDGLTASAGTVNGLCLDSAKRVTVNSASTCIVSSRKYKHDIAELTVDATSQIMKLVPSTFVYNDGVKTNIGFIAEEAADVNPLFVGYKDGQPHSLDTTAILSVTVKALQESNAKIDSLEARIEKLEKLLNEKNK